MADFFSTAMLHPDDDEDAMDPQMKSPFGSSFRTFDATNYKPIGDLNVSAGRVLWFWVAAVLVVKGNDVIVSLSPSATVDVKKNIFDLCTDSKDRFLAVIEV